MSACNGYSNSSVHFMGVTKSLVANRCGRLLGNHSYSLLAGISLVSAGALTATTISLLIGNWTWCPLAKKDFALPILVSALL